MLDNEWIETSRSSGYNDDGFNMNGIRMWQGDYGIGFIESEYGPADAYIEGLIVAGISHEENLVSRRVRFAEGSIYMILPE